jgi:endonuclease YncB( thermonuclease family)
MLRTVVLIALVTMCALAANTSNGTDLLIKEADILKLNGTTYRLDGIDAPELDQVCLDEHGAVWR